MIIQREKITIGAEALAGAVVGACAGVLLVSIPWMWRTFPPVAPSDQTAIAQTVASGIERVISIFSRWPEWEVAAVVGAVAGTLVGLIVGVVGYIDRRAGSEHPGGATGTVIGALTGFVLLGSIGTLIAGYGLGLGFGLFIGLYPGVYVGWFIGGITGSVPCGFADKFDKHQQRREEEKMREQCKREQRATYDRINTLVTYFIEKMKEVGNPGLVEPHDDPALNDPYVSAYAHLGKGNGDRSKLPWHTQGVWWSGVGSLQCASINPAGQWRYIAPIFDNRIDEIDSYWEFSSAVDSEEPNLSFPYEPYNATYESAYGWVRTIVKGQLEKHNPSTLTELPFS